MTPEEIIAIAKEARISEMGLNIDGSSDLLGLFERFAALVAAKERESIAAHYAAQPHVEFFGAELAEEIRARGQKEGA